MNLAGEFPQDTALPDKVRAFLYADSAYLIRRADNVCGNLMDGDYLRSVIWNAICVLNVRHLTRSGDTMLYAGLFDFPPDSARVPVTIRQLALATRLPYETVRRQAQNLVRDGYCVFVPKQGVMTPTEVFQRPKFLASGRYVVTAMQRLLADLQRCGFDFDTIARAGRAAQPDAMTVGRAVIRLNGEYTMNQLEVLRVPHNNDPVEALIFMAIAAANRRQADGAEADGVLPDALRRPISALAAASSLNIPYETVRRLLNRMEKSGRLARAKDGFFVPAEVERRIEDEEMLRKRYVCLLRYLADLKFIGVPMPA